MEKPPERWLVAAWPGIGHVSTTAAEAGLPAVGLPLDLGELEQYGRSMQAQLALLYEQVMQALREDAQAEAPEPPRAQTPRATMLADEDDERLFQEARSDLAKGFVLKKEPDRLGVFARYEDRFINLFDTLE